MYSFIWLYQVSPVACELLVAACGIWFPNQGSNLGPLPALGAWSLSHWTTRGVPTPIFLPGEFHGQRSLVGYSSWGREESDTTERLTLSHLCPCWRKGGVGAQGQRPAGSSQLQHLTDLPELPWLWGVGGPSSFQC